MAKAPRSPSRLYASALFSSLSGRSISFRPSVEETYTGAFLVRTMVGNSLATESVRNHNDRASRRLTVRRMAMVDRAAYLEPHGSP